MYHTAKEQETSEKIKSHLVLQNKTGLNTKYINLSPDTIADIQESICSVLTESLVSDIKSSPVYSIMLDESTDISVEKKLSICVRYVKLGEPLTIFLCNLDLPDGCAHTIISKVVEPFDKLGIELPNCTSLPTDGAVVMMGQHIHHFKCTDTIKKEDFLVKFRDKFNVLYYLISASHSRVSALKYIQALLEEPEFKIKESYSIRWLRLKKAVEAAYETYAAVLSTLSKFAAEKKCCCKRSVQIFQ